MTEPAVKDVVADITADIRTIVQGEVELAKRQLIPSAKKAGIGAALIAAGAVFMLIMLNVLFVMLGFLFTNLFWGHTATPVGAFGFGFLCAAGVYLLLGVILAVVGILFVKKFEKPTDAIDNAKASVAAVKTAINRGLADVKIFSTRGKKKITRDASGQIVSVVAAPKRAVND